VASVTVGPWSAASPPRSLGILWAWSALWVWLLGELGMRRAFRVFGVLGVLGVLRMLGSVRILWRPLLAAPGQPGRAAKRMLLHFHAAMLAARVSIAWALADAAHLIRVAKLRD
jgi:hypothetical protein